MARTLPRARGRYFFRIADFWRGRPRPHEDEAARDGRSAGRGTPVLGRRHPHEGAEARGEGADALEPDEETDLGYGQVGRSQQVLGTLDPAPGQILPRSLTVRLGERPREVKLGQMRRLRHRVESEDRGKVAFGELAPPPQRDE